MDLKHQTHRHTKGRSASGPMFIRGFPYMVIEWLSPHLFLPILSPVVNYSASSKMVLFFSRHYGGETSNSSVLGWLVSIRPHAYQGFPLYGYSMTVSTLICAFFNRPLWNISCRVKWFEFSVGTREVKHQTHRHSKGWSVSGPMYIRGFPLYYYLMTVSTPIFANVIARFEWFRVK